QYNSFGAITGKPLAVGGSAGRTVATARGCVVVLEELLKKLGQGKRLLLYYVGFRSAKKRSP
ncbi:MAG TPA: hypothetical protein VHS59_01125, partial [Bacillota bacterium]|nr:hypothetical protein [Bacillota bacterium]